MMRWYRLATTQGTSMWAHAFPLPDEPILERDFLHMPRALCGYDPAAQSPVRFLRATQMDARCLDCARRVTA